MQLVPRGGRPGAGASVPDSRTGCAPKAPGRSRSRGQCADPAPATPPRDGSNSGQAGQRRASVTPQVRVRRRLLAWVRHLVGSLLRRHENDEPAPSPHQGRRTHDAEGRNRRAQRAASSISCSWWKELRVLALGVRNRGGHDQVPARALSIDSPDDQPGAPVQERDQASPYRGARSAVPVKERDRLRRGAARAPLERREPVYSR